MLWPSTKTSWHISMKLQSGMWWRIKDSSHETIRLLMNCGASFASSTHYPKMAGNSIPWASPEGRYAVSRRSKSLKLSTSRLPRSFGKFGICRALRRHGFSGISDLIPDVVLQLKHGSVDRPRDHSALDEHSPVGLPAFFGVATVSAPEGTRTPGPLAPGSLRGREAHLTRGHRSRRNDSRRYIP
jgi:hypothetical protein